MRREGGRDVRREGGRDVRREGGRDVRREGRDMEGGREGGRESLAIVPLVQQIITCNI